MNRNTHRQTHTHIWTNRLFKLYGQIFQLSWTGCFVKLKCAIVDSLLQHCKSNSMYWVRNPVHSALQPCTYVHMYICGRLRVKKQACCAGCRYRPFTAKAPPIGKIHQFCKIAVTFKPVLQFGCHSRFRISRKNVK